MLSYQLSKEIRGGRHPVRLTVPEIEWKTLTLECAGHLDQAAIRKALGDGKCREYREAHTEFDKPPDGLGAP